MDKQSYPTFYWASMLVKGAPVISVFANKDTGQASEEQESRILAFLLLRFGIGFVSGHLLMGYYNIYQPQLWPSPGHDDVIKWKHFPRYWPSVRRIHRSPVNSPHKSQWRGALVFSFICAWINGWVNNRKTGDLRHHRAHYDVIVMQ